MEQEQSYGRRMWRIWSPLAAKFGIAMLVSFMFAFALIWRYLAQQGIAGDPYALMELMDSTEKMQEMSETVLGWSVDTSVLMEGTAALIGIPVFLFWMHRDKVRERMQKGAAKAKKAPFWKYPAVVGLAAAMCLGLNNLILLTNLTSYSQSYEETMEVFYRPSLEIQIICLGVLVPVCEELVYRGLMYRRMRTQMKFLQAAIYSSAVFAVTHGNLVQSLYGFAMGMMLAYVYEKYGSAAAPVMGHITANVMAVLGTYYHWFDWMLEGVMRVGIVTVACAAAASTIYVLMQRMEV